MESMQLCKLRTYAELDIPYLVHESIFQHCVC